jgi:ribosomal protein S18 acetylase RimI-like enzyme
MINLEPITLRNEMLFKAVRLQALQESPSAFGSTYARESQFSDAEWSERIQRWNGRNGIGFLAMDLAVPCGIAGGLLDEGQPSQVQLVSMWIAPSHRRQGVGRMLVNEVLSWAHGRSAETLTLMVTSGNEAAIRFYERLGFVMTGRTELYANDAGWFKYEMALPIVSRGQDEWPATST